MSGPVFTVTAHYAGGGERKLPNVPRSDALAFMRKARDYDPAAAFTVEGPHAPPARSRLALVWN